MRPRASTGSVVGCCITEGRTSTLVGARRGYGGEIGLGDEGSIETGDSRELEKIKIGRTAGPPQQTTTGVAVGSQ